MKRILLAAVAASFLSAPAAADGECAKMMSMNLAMLSLWQMGFMSGWDWACRSDPKYVRREFDQKDILRYVRNFCAENPNRVPVEGMIAMLRERGVAGRQSLCHPD
jgi:hypothetical protein